MDIKDDKKRISEKIEMTIQCGYKIIKRITYI